MKPFVMTDACPCGRWLEIDTPAPDAESLMRSRCVREAGACWYVEGEQ